MTARPGQAIALDRAELRRIRRRAILAAILWGVLSALWTQHVLTWATPQEVVDPRMEKGCVLPRAEAESTLFIVIDNRLRCWRYQ